MDILHWLDKHLSDIKGSLVFSKYFDSILMEEGIDTFYFVNPSLGIDIILDNRLYVKSIHFYSENEKRINQFPDSLPMGLEFSFSQEQSREHLGKPNISGGGGKSILYGVAPSWDKYFFKNFSLHLQFSRDLNKIELITVDRGEMDKTLDT